MSDRNTNGSSAPTDRMEMAERRLTELESHTSRLGELEGAAIRYEAKVDHQSEALARLESRLATFAAASKDGQQRLEDLIRAFAGAMDVAL